MQAVSIVLIIVVILGGVWLWFLFDTEEEPIATEETPFNDVIIDEDTTVVTPGATTSMTDNNDPNVTVVTYNEEGFSPETVTVSQGDVVQFVNDSTNDMWVASAVHPTHEEYSGTTREEHCATPAAGTSTAVDTDDAFDQCEAGNEYSFTFDQIGSWGYHNHLVPQDTGTVIVQ